MPIQTVTSSEISQRLRLMVQSGFTTATSDGAIRGLNSSCVVVAVSCYITYWSGDFMSTVNSESTRTACRQET